MLISRQPAKAVTLLQPGQLALSEMAAPPPPGRGEALVRVRRVGISSSDVQAFRGKQPLAAYPLILGHELGVVVEEVGEGVTNVAPGDQCAVEPYLNCGRCIACRRGKSNCCTTLQCLGMHTDGGMRERMVLPAHKLHPSRVLTLDQLALVETLAVGAHAVSRGAPAREETVLVIGAGPVGMAVAVAAKLGGCKVIMTDVNESRLAFARRHLEIDHAVSAELEPLAAIRSITNSDLPTTVFDATGNPSSMNKALRYVASGGAVVFVGVVQADLAVHYPEFHRKEVSLLATRNSLAADFTSVIARLERGEIEIASWITHRCSCEELVGMFPRFLDSAERCIKAMVEF